MNSDTSKAVATSPEHAAAPAERVVVVALDWTGHRLRYLAGVIDAARGVDRVVSVAVDSQAPHSDEWVAIGDRCHDLEVIEADPDESPGHVLSGLADRFDRLIVLDADRMLADVVRLVATNRSVRVTLQLMREPRLRSLAGERLTPKDRAVGAAKTALLAGLPTLSRGRVDTHLLRSPLFDFGSPARELERLGVLAPILDPVLHADDSGRVMPSEPPAGPTDSSVAILGRLDERKFVVEHLAAWERDTNLHATRLVLCGSSFDDHAIAAGVAAARRAGATVDFADRFATDAEMDEAIAGATAIICTYRSDIPSGVAALAVSAGCPVVAMAGTRLGQAAIDHALGAAIDQVGPAQLYAAIAACARLDRTTIARTAAQLHHGATLTDFGHQLLHA